MPPYGAVERCANTSGLTLFLSRETAITYGGAGGAGGSLGFSVRYQGELLGIWDLQIVILDLVENHTQKPKKRLADYHPSMDGGMLTSGYIYYYHICTLGAVNSGRHDSPHIRKSSLDHDHRVRSYSAKNDTEPKTLRGRPAGRHLRLRRPDLIAEAAKSMDAFDLVSKERVDTRRPTL